MTRIVKQATCEGKGCFIHIVTVKGSDEGIGIFGHGHVF